ETLWRAKHGGVVAKRQRGWVGRERGKITGDDVELAKAIPLDVAATLTHRLVLPQRIRVAVPCAQAGRGCRSPPWAPRRRRRHERCRHIRKWRRAPGRRRATGSRRLRRGGWRGGSSRHG